MFDFAKETTDMTPAEILNYYRNKYYAEPQVTERGIVANAINELLPEITPTVRGKWRVVYRNKIATVYECTCCQHLTLGTSDYCICGAKMEGEIT